jgi:hypothetical protein
LVLKKSPLEVTPSDDTARGTTVSEHLGANTVDTNTVSTSSGSRIRLLRHRVLTSVDPACLASPARRRFDAKSAAIAPKNCYQPVDNSRTEPLK